MLNPDQFWNLAWADFWEALDGRVWFELKKNGISEKVEYTPEQADKMRSWITDRANRAGWN